MKVESEEEGKAKSITRLPNVSQYNTITINHNTTQYPTIPGSPFPRRTLLPPGGRGGGGGGGGGAPGGRGSAYVSRNFNFNTRRQDGRVGKGSRRRKLLTTCRSSQFHAGPSSLLPAIEFGFMAVQCRRAILRRQL